VVKGGVLNMPGWTIAVFREKVESFEWVDMVEGGGDMMGRIV